MIVYSMGTERPNPGQRAEGVLDALFLDQSRDAHDPDRLAGRQASGDEGKAAADRCRARCLSKALRRTADLEETRPKIVTDGEERVAPLEQLGIPSTP